jgi:DNA-binding transcriptional ArsR family regulator
MDARRKRQLRGEFEDAAVKDYFRTLRVIAGPIRFRILMILRAAPKGLSVTEIAEVLGASLSRISHQMRILRKSKLVSSRRDSRSVIYALANPRIYRYLKLPK